MEINDYQEFTKTTAVYKPHDALSYTALGLAGEAGEVANKVKKVIRDSNGLPTDEVKRAIRSELGDTLWYIARLADELGFTMQEVVQDNVDKLTSRVQRSVISGSGDNR